MCDVLGGSCDCGSHVSLGGSCVHWVWEEGHDVEGVDCEWWGDGE